MRGDVKIDWLQPPYSPACCSELTIKSYASILDAVVFWLMPAVWNFDGSITYSTYSNIGQSTQLTQILEILFCYSLFDSNLISFSEWVQTVISVFNYYNQTYEACNDKLYWSLIW